MALTDSTGAHSGIADFTKGVDRNGNRVAPVVISSSPVRATEAVQEGDLLMYDIDGVLSSTTGLSATVPVGVRRLTTTSASEYYYAGVAGGDAAAGDPVEVITEGVVFVRVPSGTTVAVGDRIIKAAGATPGQCASSSTIDATVIAGATFGTALAVKDATTSSTNQKVLVALGRR